MAKHTLEELQQWQSLPLSIKIRMTEERIRDWVREYGEDGVYVSFSGGKDSTVLLDIVRKLYPNVKAVFVDTGLEYPEIREFVRGFANVDWLKPKMTFKQVIKKYGYPFISKEVSDCVYGARKYLTSLARREESLQTDRQTDRQTVPNHNYMADILGIDRRIDKGNPSYTAIKMGNIPSEIAHINHLKSAICGEKHIYNYECDRVFGTVKKEPARLKKLLGKLEHKEKGVITNEKSSMYDRSKYMFFLDAKFEISHMCCNVMKKSPVHAYSRKTGRMPMTAVMASESKMRTQKWLQNGCNGFNLKSPISNPMAFWTEQDVLLYIKENNLPIADVYGEIVIDYEGEGQLEGQMDLGIFEKDRRLLKTTGCDRTGCMFCGFGCHLEKSPNRFERMKETHPKQYDYIMRPKEQGGLNYKEVIDWINEHGNMNIKY